MRRFLKWSSVVLASVLGLVLLASAGVYAVSGWRMSRRYEFEVEPVAPARDSGAIGRGRHFAEAVAKCLECHGRDLGGKVVVDAPPMGRLVASNLTAGRGGIGAAYTDADYVRSVRHGPDLTGGGGPPPGAPNITPAGIGEWSEADFFTALRHGKRPDGSAISAAMPWIWTSQMTGDEIRALWLYLKNVPAKTRE